MGGKSSKLVITPENVETPVNAPEEVITQLKSNGENGNREAIPAIDSVDEPNGDAQGPADTTAETIPANGSVAETKKKTNPINSLLKKISFKKTKTVKKPTVTEEQPAEPLIEEAQPVNVEEKKEEEIPIQTQTEDVHIQSDEVPTVDQATTIPETPEVELPTEPVVEITPTAEEVQNAIGEEKFVEDEHVEVDEEVTQNGNGIPHEEQEEVEQFNEVVESNGVANDDMGISEKLANLGIEAPSESVTNGNGIHFDGDEVVPADES